VLIKKRADLTYADITPKALYMGRRNFLLGILGTAAAVKLYKKLPVVFAGPATGSVPVPLNGVVKSQYTTTGEKINSIDTVTHYNNYYEFGTDKDEPSQNARNFNTSGWKVSVEGECAKPRVITLEEILKLAPLEERVYRHRCVEAWSIVVPWIGYSLSTILNQVQPTSKAKFVSFQSYYEPKQMPLGGEAGIPLPYVEGLRLDEAMNPLALVCVGMYGETLPNQDGAPVRLILPWKYGFKSIKSIVKIRLVENQPPNTWNLYAPTEYGFYSNVNPQVDHPRWSQAKERRLGEFLKRETLMFNGYGDFVASMYAGMDLRRNF
jgi:sulfoxide reductase catalytic subunit YedY